MSEARYRGSRLGGWVEAYRVLRGAGVRRSSVILYPVRRRFPRWRRNQLDLRSGIRLTSATDEQLLPMFSEIWAKRNYLPDSAAAEAPVVIDIGASVGVFSVWAARELGPSRIVALEPSAESVQALRKNLLGNGIAGVTVAEVAAGGQSGEVVLYSRGPGALNTIYPRDRLQSRFEVKRRVPMVTLDDVFAKFQIRHCDLLKLDCEGAEYEILFGASEWSLARVHQIVGEYHEGLNEHRVSELDEYLSARGFTVTIFPPLDVEGGHFHASRTAPARGRR